MAQPLPRRVLRFRDGFPFFLESKLINRFGYAVDQRVKGQFVSFIYSPREPTSNIIKPAAFHSEPKSTGLPIYRQSELMKRCDNIVDFFPDPYNQERAVRTRLHNMAQTLPENERQFVQDYMDDNFPVPNKGL